MTRKFGRPHRALDDDFGQGFVAASGTEDLAYQWRASSGYRSDGDGLWTGSYNEPLVKVGARYYIPSMGVFITWDTDLSQKPYEYCNADPVNNVDPSGHDTSATTKTVNPDLTTTTTLTTTYDDGTIETQSYTTDLLGNIINESTTYTASENPGSLLMTLMTDGLALGAVVVGCMTDGTVVPLIGACGGGYLFGSWLNNASAASNKANFFLNAEINSTPFVPGTGPGLHQVP